MELRSFDFRRLPFPPWVSFSVAIGVGGGIFVFFISLISPASFLYSLIRGIIAFLIFFGESVFFLCLLSKYDLDSLLFGRKIKVDLRSLASLKDFAWVYRLKKEEKVEQEKPPEEKSSLEKLLSEPSEFEEKVEELTEVVKKKPESAAKVIRIMMEEG